MANEYNELEQLVNDVTNIDTARMTLRWALERLNSIEKERAELRKTLSITEDTRKSLEAKVQTLEQSFKSRGKALEEKEGFYAKLEATMALLGDGKLDIQQLLKKESRLDQARLELEREYQDKFEELDRNQNSVIARWNQRLLDVEGQYAKRLSESQARYDSLRQELEADHQGRLGALETSYLRKEKELTERIAVLEASLKDGGNALESRRKEVESEFLAKKNEIEGNYLKLKAVLETGFQDRIRSMENDHSAQVRSLEKTWNAERERLMTEQRARDEQFEKSQKEMSRLEAQLSAQQEQHHRELIDLISRKEEAFRRKVEDLEKERAAYERTAEELAVRLESKEKDWEAQKNLIQADFDRRRAEIESAAMDRVLAMEKDSAARNESMEKLIAASKDEFAREASARVEGVRRDLEAENAVLAEDNQLKTAALDRAAEMIRELEVMLASSGESHHRELLEKIRSNEENFRAKLAEFEAEKRKYQGSIAGLTAAAGERDARFIEETERVQKQFADKYAELEAKAAETAARDRAAYEERLAALTLSLENKEKSWVLERERLCGELAAVSNGAQELASERVEKVKASYEARKAELEKQFEEKLAGASSALAFEKAQMLSDLKTASEQYTRLSERFKELENTIAEDRKAHHEEVMLKLAEKEAALKAQAEEFGKELALKDELASQAAEDSSGKEMLWLEEKKRLSADFAARLRMQGEGLAQREAALENQYRLKAAELEKNAAEVRELMEADFNRRVEVEKQAFEAAKARLSDENRLKGEQLAEARAAASERVEKIRAVYEARKADLEKQTEERLAAARGAMESEKARLAADLAAAGEEYARLSERSKELESAIADDRRRHHQELMARMAEKEAALKDQADGFNKEISSLREDMDAREDAWLAERGKIMAAAERRCAAAAEEFGRRKTELERIYDERLAEREAVLKLEAGKILEASRLKDERLENAHERIKELEGRLDSVSGAHHRELSARLADKEAALKEQAEALRREKDAALKAQAGAFAGELAEARKEFGAREAFLLEEKERLNGALSEASARAEREIKERAGIIAAEYENKKTELERVLEERMAAASGALAFEKARMLADLKTASAEYTKLSEHSKELENTIARDRQAHHEELMMRMSEKEEALKEQENNFNKETLKLREEMSAREAGWQEEREKLRSASAEAAVRAEKEASERAALMAQSYERKKAELERILGERLSAKEAGFRLETAKILEESKLKDERLAATYARVKELENRLNESGAAHHQELMARLAEKEAALKAQAEALNREKADALEEQARVYREGAEASARAFTARESSLRAEKEKAEASAASAAAAAERGLKALSEKLAADHENRRAELEKQYEEKYAAASEALAFEKARFIADLKTASDEYTKLAERSKELENTIAADRQAHHRELMEKLAEKEAALKAQAGTFGKELDSLRGDLSSRESSWSREKDKLNAALEEAAARAEREQRAHAARVEAEYDRKKAELERVLNERLAEKEAFLKLEAEKILEASRLKDGRLEKAHARVKELENRMNAMSTAQHEELAARLAEKEAALKAQAEAFNKERASALEAQARAFREETETLSREFGAREAALRAEREKASEAAASASAAAERELKTRWEKLSEDHGNRKAELEKEFEDKFAAASKALAFEKARLIADLKTASDEYTKLAERSKELENTIAADRQAHHRELMEKLAEKEAALQAQSEGFKLELAKTRERFASEKDRIARQMKAQEEKLAAAHENMAELQKRMEAEKDSHREELETGLKEKEAVLSARMAALEQEHSARREALAAGFAARESALNKEAEARSASEREAWQAQQARLEAMLSRSLEDVKKAQKEIEALSSAVSSREEENGLLKDRLAEQARKAAEDLRNAESRALAGRSSELEAAYKERKARLEAETASLRGELQEESRKRAEEASARFEANLRRLNLENGALKDAVSRMREEIAAAQSKADSYMNEIMDKEHAHQTEMLKLKETLAGELESRLAEAADKAVRTQQERVRSLEKELARVRQDNADSLRNSEEAFRREKERLDEELVRRQEYIASVDAKMRGMEESLMTARQEAAASYLGQIADQDDKFKALADEYAARQDKLESEAAARVEAARKEGEERLKALESRFKTAEKAAFEEKEARLRKAAELEARNAELSAGLHRLGEELRAREAALAEREARLEQLAEKTRLQKEEALKLRETYAAELEARVSQAGETAASPLRDRVLALERDLAAERDRARGEAAVREADHKREKERLEEELGRRAGYLEAADLKLRETEAELIRARQNAASAYVDRIAEHDDKFKEMIREYEDRQAKLEKASAARLEGLKEEYENRLRDMEEMLKAKDSLVRQGGEFWRQKQAEVDAEHSALNIKINSFNEEMFAQRQALSERENALNAQQLEREKELSAKMSEIQKLKVELTRTIAEYKNRK